MKNKNCTDHSLRDLPFFSGLKEEDMHVLFAAGKVRDYSKSEHIFRQGDAADRLFIVLQGQVKRYCVTADGEETTVMLCMRGDVLGEACIFESSSHTFSSEATTDARMLEIPDEALRERARENSDIPIRVMAALSRDMHRMQMENEHRALMNAPQRIGCLLLQASSGIESEGAGGTFGLPYSKALAAQILGMRPETFSRALMQLRSFGVSAPRERDVTIADYNRLIDYCCQHCTSLPGECRGSKRQRKVH